jgi:hypothetical protein
MKRLWIGVVILVILSLLGIGSTLAMEKIHAPIARQLESASEAAVSGHWQEARILAAGAKVRWEQHRKFVACISDHEALEAADARFARLDALQESGNASLLPQPAQSFPPCLMLWQICRISVCRI